ncbi:YqgE/AlgH family protein [Chitinophaga lutea]|uniref:YqgE/AlgH family protein n=1 Tax=Chitinophaga lutea TaxID=2488634 RepID=A0A3N4Q0B6_9BACT|nr:YqgE/AlgH family protein [Chitinophaga lutea]RPE09717.1 YqgE/AlgH family protein [Chitinophaga lutea]
MKAGTFLKSTALLDDTFFEQSVIFITDHNEKGAMGFVVNRQFPRKLNELVEFMHAGPFPLYEGGPVDQEHLYFVHRRPDLIEGGAPVADGIYLGGNFSTAVQLIAQQTLQETDVRIFVGYCGWDNGELEAEVAEGSWEVLHESLLFNM